MLSYCFKCRQNTESENPRAVKSKREKPLILSKQCVVVKIQDLSKNGLSSGP